MRILAAETEDFFLPRRTFFRKGRGSPSPRGPERVAVFQTVSPDEPLYNSRILNTYLEFTRATYPELPLGELLAYAGVEPYQVKDEGHWFTQEQHDRFHEKLVQLTGNPSVAREAGRYAAASRGTGFFQSYALSWMGPTAAFAVLGRLASRFTHSADYRCRRLSAHSLEVVVTPREGIREKPYQCENRLGMFQAVFDFFQYRLLRSKHPECVFNGGRVCRYLFTWETPPSVFWKRIRNALALLLVFFGILLVPYFPWDTLILFSALSLWSLLSALIHAFEKKELSEKIKRLRRAVEEQIDHIEINYHNAGLVHEIGWAINKNLKVDGISAEVMHSLQKHLDYDRGLILLVDNEKKGLHLSAAYGLTDEETAFLRQRAFPLDDPFSPWIFRQCYKEQKPIVRDAQGTRTPVTGQDLAFLPTVASRSFICCPILFEKETLGILVVDHLKKKRPLTQTDVSLLSGIAHQIGISINNARLKELQKDQFHSILRVLAASIDARDPLTAGHSEKVTEYSLGIARAMGLNETFCEVLGIAALLHDYGKLGIQDHILKKPGQLTPEESREIHSHAIKSKRILEQMNFTGEFAEIPSWTGAHHEKYDGSGYPEGLKGEAIPLGARIIAVADVFEALTAQRHYRNPMPMEEALKIIKEGSGKDFDPRVVEAFERYFRKTFGRKGHGAPVYKTVSPRDLIQGRLALLH
jgi:HD-GYP domain-containing protein (c-di-GMP phosphodiesterase class II)